MKSKCTVEIHSLLFVFFSELETSRHKTMDRKGTSNYGLVILDKVWRNQNGIILDLKILVIYKGFLLPFTRT